MKEQTSHTNKLKVAVEVFDKLKLMCYVNCDSRCLTATTQAAAVTSHSFPFTDN